VHNLTANFSFRSSSFLPPMMSIQHQRGMFLSAEESYRVEEPVELLLRFPQDEYSTHAAH
jgi:hypothetical protein